MSAVKQDVGIFSFTPLLFISRTFFVSLAEPCLISGAFFHLSSGTWLSATTSSSLMPCRWQGKITDKSGNTECTTAGFEWVPVRKALFTRDFCYLFRYIYIFWLKNPAAFHDDFWSQFHQHNLKKTFFNCWFLKFILIFRVYEMANLIGKVFVKYLVKLTPGVCSSTFGLTASALFLSWSGKSGLKWHLNQTV